MPENAEPRWLDDDQQRNWRAFLSGNTRINEHLELALRPFGLDLADYGQLFPQVVLLSVVPVVILLRLQRYFVGSLAATGSKG